MLQDPAAMTFCLISDRKTINSLCRIFYHMPYGSVLQLAVPPSFLLPEKYLNISELHVGWICQVDGIIYFYPLCNLMTLFFELCVPPPQNSVVNPTVFPAI